MHTIGEKRKQANQRYHIVKGVKARYRYRTDQKQHVMNGLVVVFI